MARVVVRLSISILAVIGSFTAAGWLWSAVRPRRAAPDYLTIVSSPDGKFEAARARWAGGGGIAPYCYDRVFVVDAGTAASRVADEENVVFAGACASFALKDGVVRDSPELSWRDPRVLTIRFSVHYTGLGPSTFRLRGVDASRQVTIEFAAGN